MAKGIVGISPQSWTNCANALQHLLPQSAQFANVGDKAHKAAGVLACSSIDALYLGLVSHWRDPAAIVINGREPATLLTANAPKLAMLNDTQRMMLLDTLTYLPDDILVKVDRAAMGVSLESRVPFLDHRVVEFAWRLPQHLKLQQGQSKWLLRQILYRHVPKALIERPKMGFGIPIDVWLRGALRDWAEALLDESRLRNEGFFHPAPIRQKWLEHLSGTRNWQYDLWDILMFQSWLKQSGFLTSK
jgi:asparagine synthase (glutamine-hydrolysing)